MKATIETQVFEKFKKIFHEKNTRILIVDDHLPFAKALEMIILSKNKDASVTIVSSFENAIKLLEDNHFDLVLLDNALTSWRDSPNRLGTELIPLIRWENPQGLILFTSMNLPVAKRLLLQREIDHYVDKAKFFDFLQELERI